MDGQKVLNRAMWFNTLSANLHAMGICRVIPTTTLTHAKYIKPDKQPPIYSST